jgi:hypothetical protein
MPALEIGNLDEEYSRDKTKERKMSLTVLLIRDGIVVCHVKTSEYSRLRSLAGQNLHTSGTDRESVK